MKKPFSILIALLLFLLPLSGYPSEMKGGVGESHDTSSAGQVLRRFFPDAALTKLIPLSKGARGLFKRTGKSGEFRFWLFPWDEGPQGTILVMEDASDKGNGKRFLISASAERGGKFYKGEATVGYDFLKEDYDCPMTSPNEVEFDPTGMRIRPDENAFGLRIESAGRDAGEAEHGRTLLLFRLSGCSFDPAQGCLYPILRTRIEHQIWPTGKEKATEELYALEVDKRPQALHGGFFDLILKQTKGGAAKRLFRWDGESYREM